jgi:hypothetical protein
VAVDLELAGSRPTMPATGAPGRAGPSPWPDAPWPSGPPSTPRTPSAGRLRQAGRPGQALPARQGRGQARHPRRAALVPPGRHRGRPRHDRGRPPPPGRGVRHLPLPDRARPARRAGPGRAAAPCPAPSRTSGR